VEEVGSEWAKSYTIDVAGISEATTSLVLGDCYWQTPPLGPEAIEELIRKTPNIVPKKNGNWSVYYALFSAGGWTEEAQEQAENILDEIGWRKRWHAVGIRLLSLEEVDADLVNWSA
jgi:hypothetical protein